MHIGLLHYSIVAVCVVPSWPVQHMSAAMADRPIKYVAAAEAVVVAMPMLAHHQEQTMTAGTSPDRSCGLPSVMNIN